MNWSDILARQARWTPDDSDSMRLSLEHAVTLYNDAPLHIGSATNQANQYISQHFDGYWVSVLRQINPKKFEDWIAQIKQCLIKIFTDPKYRCLESYAGCNELREKLRTSSRRTRRQSADLDPFPDPKLQLAILLEESTEDPFDKKVVN